MKKLLSFALVALMLCAAGCTGPNPESSAGIEISVELAVEPAVSNIKADFWQGDKLVLTEDILPADGGTMPKNQPVVFDIDPQQLGSGTVDIVLSMETEDGQLIEVDPVTVKVDYEHRLYVLLDNYKNCYYAVFGDDLAQGVEKIAAAIGAPIEAARFILAQLQSAGIEMEGFEESNRDEYHNAYEQEETYCFYHVTDGQGQAYEVLMDKDYTIVGVLKKYGAAIVAGNLCHERCGTVHLCPGWGGSGFAERRA